MSAFYYVQLVTSPLASTLQRKLLSIPSNLRNPVVSRHCRGYALFGRPFLGSARAREARGRFLHNFKAGRRTTRQWKWFVRWNIIGIIQCSLLGLKWGLNDIIM